MPAVQISSIYLFQSIIVPLTSVLCSRQQGNFTSYCWMIAPFRLPTYLLWNCLMAQRSHSARLFQFFPLAHSAISNTTTNNTTIEKVCNVLNDCSVLLSILICCITSIFHKDYCDVLIKLPDICFDKYQLQLHVIGSYYGQPQRVLSLNLPLCNLQIF